jgi:hypothetical protein
MSGPCLQQTQRLLWQLITAPEGAAAGLSRLAASERVVAESLLRGNQQLPAPERIDIYADMYFYRLLDCLKEDFPAMCAVVGERNFHNLITDYLIAHPPSHFSLRYAGQHLPAFVREHSLSASWSYLGDLAMFEWSILEAFDAPDAPPLEPAVLTAIAPEQWPDLRFELTPTLRLLALSWPVRDIWQQTQSGEAPAQIHPERMSLRVWRQKFRVFHCPIDANETTALTAIARGVPFAEVCAEVLECCGESDASDHVVRLLRQWLADGLLTGCATTARELPGC